MRDALLPLVLWNLSVDSMENLKELSISEQHILGLIRHLNVTLSFSFSHTWAQDAGTTIRSVISRTQYLRSLSLTVGDTGFRGLSLGSELPGTVLPTFERLTHLKLQMISASSIEILLSRAPYLSSLAITLPDRPPESEMSRVLSVLKHVPLLKELTISLSEWECHAEASHAKEVLSCVGQRLPKLEKLDLRTQVYDLIDGVMVWKCVDAEMLRCEDFVSLIPLFPHLHTLRLPFKSRKGNATKTCAEIARLSPKLEVISWMQYIDFESKLDEYTITRSADSETSIVRSNPPIPLSQNIGTTPTAGHPSRSGFSLFDTIFSNFIDPSKPSISSDLAVTFSVLMVIGSMLLSPFYTIFQ
ncbi:hypothetical protein FRB98_008345 [Tulasnella sp. 332]|nr:hypothetical protein FRB98_008345 [Tulasnella sp. 332]